MRWSEVGSQCTLSISALITVMARWSGQSEDELREALKPAEAETITALAAPLEGGLHALPPVYRDYLEQMGESAGPLELTWGTLSASDLVHDLTDTERERPDVQRYLKFSIGEEGESERHPDDFFDLQQRTEDGKDAAILRIHEQRLLAEEHAEQPFETFSDLVRAVVTVNIGLRVGQERSAFALAFGDDPQAAARVFAMLESLGFEPTPLGMSQLFVPLEAPKRGAIALLYGPSRDTPRTRLRMRAADERENTLLREILLDNEDRLRHGSTQ